MSEQKSSTPPCNVCPMLRKRLHDLEEAVEDYIVVMEETGQKRLESLKAVTTALTYDFKTAILASHDMTDEQRAYWLAEGEKAAQPAATSEEAAS